EGELLQGMSIVHPGKVGNEYFMTKGHFHSILNTAEFYYCVKGNGYMMMENPEGGWAAEELLPNTVLYVPGRWAHRSINVKSDEDLITIFAYPATAGHDYATIETKGFRKLVIEKDGKPAIVDNPKWK
ncbi:MAG: glucose-6-phosphate isomerase, partial [Actinobacteria bacterium]|nr:glucose-6-phosphate isomerase [Actinomycetota bacterium]